MWREISSREELDYQPNKAARALAYRDNYKQLAIVFPSWSGYFRRDIEHGIADAEENLSDFGVSVQPYIYDQRNHKVTRITPLAARTP